MDQASFSLAVAVDIYDDDPDDDESECNDVVGVDGFP
jgi:hypothetical protein